MNRNTWVAFLLACLSPWLGGAPLALGEDHAVNGHVFSLPAGFTIEKIAGPPLVDRPITADFDDQGRLYVADSSGSNDPVQKQLAERTHRIVRLVDTNGDGVFDKSTVFADKMMFPEGTLWFRGSVYVSAPPSIWKLTDSDDDGVADQRQEWFQGKTLTGCANDLHGPYAGPDGWIYWAKGAFAQQTYERPGKSPLVTRASHIFRSRPDNTGIEPVMTGGMDNPVDVVFTPGGERLFTTTFLQHPGGGKRDGIIHAIYGGVYGKTHDVIDNHVRTHPEVMPVLVHLGPAAPCGLARAESDQFGPGYRDSVYACAFNMHKVTRHLLTPQGATFTTKDEDFLVSNNLDFHPTDIQEDADGSLVVVDTGGWYKLCCPTSQLSKPDVLGAIYRVRRTAATKLDDPRGRRIEWKTQGEQVLGSLLGDDRPAVRRQAVETLAQRRTAALPTIQQVLSHAPSIEARRQAVWTACRIDGPEARAVVRLALKDQEETVRQAALHAVSVRDDRDAIEELLPLLASPSRHNRRAAAEALGRIGDARAIPALLEAAADETNDRALDHSITYALIEIGDAKATQPGMQLPSSRARSIALVALDQMEKSSLEPQRVIGLLDSTDAGERDTAAWVLTHHPQWSASLAGVLRQRLTRANDSLEAEPRRILVGLLAQFAGAEQVASLLGETIRAEAESTAGRSIALEAMAASGLREARSAWLNGLTRLLNQAAAQGDEALARQTLAVLRATPPAKGEHGALADSLRAVGATDRLGSAIRLEALAAVPGGLSQLDPPIQRFLLENLAGETPIGSRLAAADVLARARLSIEQAELLLPVVRGSGPLEIDRLLPAFEKFSDESLGLKLIDALKASPGLTSLRAETLRPRLAKFGGKAAREAESVYSLLEVDLTKQRARLEALLKELGPGDVRRGQLVFQNAKAACVTCHAIGYIGGKVGPDLTKIGQVREPRDLLESIVAPSASFVRSYEPISVATKDGKVVNGILRKDAADEVVLAINADQEVRIVREEVEEMRPGTVSIMPAGLEQQISRQELADLVAFLRACGR